MKKLMFSFVVFFLSTGLKANDLNFYNYPEAKKTTFETPTPLAELPAGIACKPTAEGYVAGEVTEITYLNKRSLSIRVGGVWYMATKIKYNTVAPLIFKAENIGRITIWLDDDAQDCITNKKQLVSTLKQIFMPKNQEFKPYFLPENADFSAEVNGFTPQDDFCPTHNFLASRSTEFNNENTQKDVFSISYSSKTETFKIIHLTQLNKMNLNQIMDLKLTNPGEQLLEIWSGNQTPFAHFHLNKSFDLTQDIPQTILSLEYSD